MKTTIVDSLKLILSDRLVTVLLGALIVAALAYSIFVTASLRPSDLQVAVHYTAFGETSFYRDKWYYLITFVVFGMLIVIIHTALAVKIYLQGQRDLALAFTLFGLVLIAIGWFLTQAVLKIAFL